MPQIVYGLGVRRLMCAVRFHAVLDLWSIVCLYLTFYNPKSTDTLSLENLANQPCVMDLNTNLTRKISHRQLTVIHLFPDCDSMLCATRVLSLLRHEFSRSFRTKRPPPTCTALSCLYIHTQPLARSNEIEDRTCTS